MYSFIVRSSRKNVSPTEMRCSGIKALRAFFPHTAHGVILKISVEESTWLSQTALTSRAAILSVLELRCVPEALSPLLSSNLKPPFLCRPFPERTFHAGIVQTCKIVGDHEMWVGSNSAAELRHTGAIAVVQLLHLGGKMPYCVKFLCQPRREVEEGTARAPYKLNSSEGLASYVQLDLEKGGGEVLKPND